jgi:hypothetical protein
LILIAGSLFLNNLQAQEYVQGSFKVELTASGPELVFLMKLTSPSASKSLGFTGIEFVMTYSDTYTMTFGAPVSNTTHFPTLVMAYAGQNVLGNVPGKTTEWWYYTGLPTTTTSYTAGVEYEVFRVPVATSGLDFGDLNLEYDGSTYATYLVFTDAIGTGWTTADQFLDEPVFYGPGTYTGDNGDVVLMGGSCAYSIFDKPLVPMVLWDDATWAGGTGPGSSPGAGDAAKKLYVRDLNGAVTASPAAVTDVIIQTGASLDLMPNSGLTASGPTTITDAMALTVHADATGVGSFIDNGTITYGGSGSAMVETYVTNAGAGSFYMHQVGPTVDITGSGVLLGDFDLNGATYAYFYDESVAPSGAWVNIFDVLTPVATAKGLVISTVDNTDYTLDMTGALVTGAVVSPVLGHSGVNVDLISNPYASSIDFDLFQLTNAGVITTTYYIWQPGNGNYGTYTVGGGGTLSNDILPGQGFFVLTTAAAPVSFLNTHRVHSAGPLVKSDVPYLLTLEAAGNNFKDYTHVQFRDMATNNYDVMYDAHKWASIFPEATEISTLSADMEYLTMNANPMLSGNEMFSVPMTFKCSAADTYTITATGIESFDGGTQIFLEDLVAGGEWYDLVQNPVYEFTGNPGDDNNRFIVHFFGPTGIGDLDSSPISIYSWGHDAYIVNHGNEAIKEYVAYDLMGRELHRGTLPNSTVNKVTIGDVSAYYIVKVITKEGRIFTEKVYITK